MFTKNWKCVVLAVLVALTVPVLAHAEVASTISETFGTAADPFPGTSYPKWSTGTGTWAVASGVLTDTLGLAPRAFDSAYVTATSAFGQADFGTEVTVSGDVMVNGNTMNNILGLRIGNLFAGNCAGQGSDTVHMYYTSTDSDREYTETSYNTGFTLVPDTWYHMSIEAKQNGANWDVTLGVSDSTHSFSTTGSFSDSVVTGGTGLITKAGFAAGGYSDINWYVQSFDDFQVTGNVIPEPASAVLLLLGLPLLIRRRRRGA